GLVGLVMGISWDRALEILVVPLSVMGFGGGCGISLARLIRLHLDRPDSKWPDKTDLSRAKWSHQAETGRVGSEGRSHAYLPGEAAQAMPLKQHEPSEDRETDQSRALFDHGPPQRWRERMAQKSGAAGVNLPLLPRLIFLSPTLDQER